MLVSLIIPFIADFEAARTAENDIKSFFSKFGISGELIWVIDPETRWGGLATKTFSADELSWIQLSDEPGPFQRKVLVNKKRIGRGPSVARGLNEASGDLLCVLSVDLSIPLSEVFAALRLFLNDPHHEIELVLGERSERKQQGRDLRKARKKFFDSVEMEKASSLIHRERSPDPLTPFFMIRKELWQKISPSLSLRTWYYTPKILQTALEQKATLHSIAITHRRDAKTHQRWWESSFT